MQALIVEVIRFRVTAWFPRVDQSTGFYRLDPYGSSKYALDLVNLALNKRLNPKGVYSYTCCPGLVMTGVAYGIMPQWVWMLLIVPLLMLV